MGILKRIGDYMRFRVILSGQGKDVFRGGNVPVMKKMLVSFDARDLRHAEGLFFNRLIEVMGSASLYLFKVEKVK